VDWFAEGDGGNSRGTCRVHKGFISRAKARMENEGEPVKSTTYLMGLRRRIREMHAKSREGGGPGDHSKECFKTQRRETLLHNKGGERNGRDKNREARTREGESLRGEVGEREGSTGTLPKGRIGKKEKGRVTYLRDNRIQRGNEGFLKTKKPTSSKSGGRSAVREFLKSSLTEKLVVTRDRTPLKISSGKKEAKRKGRPRRVGG